MPGPVYAYKWWDAPRRSAIEWQQGRSLLLFAAAAASFPAGRAAFELPPQQAARPISVGWQAPQNRVLQLQQPVTVKSASSLGLPSGATSRAALEPANQGRSFQLFAPPAAAPVGRAFTDRPLLVPANPGPATSFSGSGTPTPQVVTIPSAGWTDIPARSARFRPADLAGIPIPAPVAAALRSAQCLDIPARPSVFTQAATKSAPLQPQISVIVGAEWTELPTRATPWRQADAQALPLQLITPTLRSGQSFELPQRPAAFRAADTQGAPLQPQAAAAPPVGSRWLDLPAATARFRAADVEGSFTLTPQTVSVPSARWLDLPPPQVRFVPADVSPTAVPAPAAAQIRSAQEFGAPARQQAFRAADLVGSPFAAAPAAALRSAQWVEAAQQARAVFRPADVAPYAPSSPPAVPSVRSGQALDLPSRLAPRSPTEVLTPPFVIVRNSGPEFMPGNDAVFIVASRDRTFRVSSRPRDWHVTEH